MEKDNDNTEYENMNEGRAKHARISIEGIIENTERGKSCTACIPSIT